MRASIRFILFVFWIVPLMIQAQVRAPGGREFQIIKITKNLIATPDYGIGQYRPTANERWLEVEVELMAAPEWTNELTLKYYILFNGRLLTGEVTHTNIPGRHENRSVM